MNWSENAWKSIENIYNDITAMPFIYELSDGTLNKKNSSFILHRTLYIWSILEGH